MSGIKTPKRREPYSNSNKKRASGKSYKSRLTQLADEKTTPD